MTVTEPKIETVSEMLKRRLAETKEENIDYLRVFALGMEAQEIVEKRVAERLVAERLEADRATSAPSK